MPAETAKVALNDPSHDFFVSHRKPFDAFFDPQSIVVVGATDRPGSVGCTVFRNLIENRRLKVYAVNPGRREVLGLPSYSSVAALPERAELAVVVTPATTVPQLVRECGQARIPAAIVISAGFRERGEAGVELEGEIAAELKRSGMRLIGPNCLGIMNPISGLNATFAQDIALKGNVAFLSQSGALLTAILDWSFRERVGFSSLVSTGSMLDVDWGDLIYHFGDDPNTRSILLYIESIQNPRSFLSAAREVALNKPIIVIKGGRTEAASKAAASHTGALTGSDEVLDAAFRRCGVLRVKRIADLFHMAEAFGKQPRPAGPRLTIVTNAGGPGVLATDALISTGGELAPLSPESIEKLNAVLPPHWSHGNPVDILGDAEPQRYERALEIAAADPNTDGLLVILAPQGMTDPATVAERVKPYARVTGKPVLATWMGGRDVAQGESILNAAGIPTFNYPDTAAQVFQYMWRYTYNLRALYETPSLAQPEPGSTNDAAGSSRGLLQSIRESGRTLLTEAESKQVLAGYGIPTGETRVARTEEECLRAASEIGYPVVVKLHSYTVTHKTDAGGVKLNLSSGAAVQQAFREVRGSVTQLYGADAFQGVTVQPMIGREGYELIVGSSIDAQFGPVMLFGSGGQLVEVFRDRALALPPLNSTLAQRLMEQTTIYKALRGVRGRKPIDVEALEALLVRFSQLIVEQRAIREVDINPLLASSDGLLALDARIVLFPASVPRDQLPRPAIRPYPAQYVRDFRMKDGQEVLIRPIRPEDEPLMVQFHRTLSERSVYLRYFQISNLDRRTAHDRLTRICFTDYDRDIVLLAVARNSAGEPFVVGVGRLSKLHGANEAEFAMLVSDQYQRRGLGTELLNRVTEIARQEGLRRVSALILRENREMQAVGERLGYVIKGTDDPAVVLALKDL
ncbi:MAG: bifunctional acetate--CoA ligase family protein/GNAT family N-acetyltransferase [Acidobacteria bacterium]|nr:bifunctional acetate--CoA ligase family protein/GNAT family N-acetyltransferase [Acidobacteriota bacterium]